MGSTWHEGTSVSLVSLRVMGIVSGLLPSGHSLLVAVPVCLPRSLGGVSCLFIVPTAHSYLPKSMWVVVLTRAHQDTGGRVHPKSYLLPPGSPKGLLCKEAKVYALGIRTFMHLASLKKVL